MQPFVINANCKYNGTHARLTTREGARERENRERERESVSE